eukprot:COSAG01_NODE_18061_length_1103_cov_1.064741_1_plen_78_part_00
MTAALATDRKGDMDALRNMLKRFNKRHRRSKGSFTKPVRDGNGNPLDTLEKQAEYMDGGIHAKKENDVDAVLDETAA